MTNELQRLKNELHNADAFAEEMFRKAKSLEAENIILKENVYDLQQQVQESYMRIKDLVKDT